MARGPFGWDEDFQRLGKRVDDVLARALLNVHVPVRETTPNVRVRVDAPSDD